MGIGLKRAQHGAMLRTENDALWFESCSERHSVAELCSQFGWGAKYAANSVMLRENMGRAPGKREGFSRAITPANAHSLCA